MYCAMYGPGMSDVRAMLGDVWAMHTPEMETYPKSNEMCNIFKIATVTPKVQTQLYALPVVIVSLFIFSLVRVKGQYSFLGHMQVKT